MNKPLLIDFAKSRDVVANFELLEADASAMGVTIVLTHDDSSENGTQKFKLRGTPEAVFALCKVYPLFEGAV